MNFLYVIINAIIITISSPVLTAVLKRSLVESSNCVSMELKNLYREQGYSIKDENKRFLINICGTVPECETEDLKDVSVCEIDDKTNNITVLGLLDGSQILSGAHSKENKRLRYYYKGKKKVSKNSVHITVDIEFICNIHSQSKISFEKSHRKNYKFIFETNYVCSNSSSYNCLMTIDQDEYNLNPLYKAYEDYTINFNSSTIILNICGSRSSNLKGDCSRKETQVCLIDDKGNYKNIGISQEDIQYSKGYLNMTFSDGSVCAEGQYSSTEIHFICSFNQTQPVLYSSSLCKYIIVWKTPYACPHSNYVYTDCETKAIGNFNSRSFNALPNSLRNISINNNGYNLRFQICGTLKDCNGYNNVTACMGTPNGDIVYGWTNSTIFQKDGAFSMKLYGEECDSDFYQFTVNFLCTYSHEKQGEIDLVEDICGVNINYYTSMACPIPEMNFKNCIVKISETSVYDLRELTLLDRNYEVRDPNNTNIYYMINICGPVIYRMNASCDGYSAVCQYNHSEPIFRKRFVSLGSLPEENIKIEVTKDGELKLKFQNGDICNGMIRHTTQIIFKCVNASESQDYPDLISKNTCTYKFKWHTHYACPSDTTTMQQKKNLVTPTANIINQNNKADNIEIKDTRGQGLLNSKANGKDNYEKILHTKNSNENIHIPSGETVIHEKTFYEMKVIPSISIPTEKLNNHGSDAGKNRTEIDQNVSYVKTDEKHKYDTDINTNSDHKNKAVVLHEVAMPHVNIVRKLHDIFIENCSVVNRTHKIIINLMTLSHNVMIKSNLGKKYSLNICDKGNNCGSPVCGGDDLKIPYGSRIISQYQFDFNNSFIKLNFAGQEECNDGFYNSTLFLKCSEKQREPKILMEDECSVQFEWYNNATCSLLRTKPEKTKVSGASIVVIGVVAGLLTFFALIIIMFLLYRKRHYYSALRKDDVRIYYSKNVQE